MPEPTDAQVDKVREIAGESDYDAVADLISDLTDGQWARALELITAWDAEYEPGAPGVSVKDVYSPTAAGMDIRGRTRLLIGLPEFRDPSLTGMPTTQAVETVWRF